MRKFLEEFRGDRLKAQLIRGFTGNTGLKIISMLLTLASGILLARVLGPEGYGVYTFVFSIIALLGLPTQAGLPTLVVRETARYYNASTWDKLHGLLLSGNIFVVGVSIITALIAGGVVWWIWDSNSEQTQAFLWALLVLPLVAFGNVRGATLRGLRKIVQGNLPEQVVRPLVMALLLVFAALLGRQVTPEIAVQYSVLAAAAAFVVGVALLARILPREVLESEVKFELNRWGKSLIPLSVYTSIDMINAQIAIIFLGIFVSSNEVGFYKVALMGATYVSVALLIANPVIGPYIVTLHKENFYKLQKMISLCSVFVTITSIIIFFIFIFFGKSIISLVFGSEYVQAYSSLIILSFGFLVSSALGSGGLVLDMTDNQNKTIYGSLTSLVLNVIFCVILIPVYGMVGAAVSFLAAIVARSLIWTILIYRSAGLNSTCFVWLGRRT